MGRSDKLKNMNRTLMRVGAKRPSNCGRKLPIIPCKCTFNVSSHHPRSCEPTLAYMTFGKYPRPESNYLLWGRGLSNPAADILYEGALIGHLQSSWIPRDLTKKIPRNSVFKVLAIIWLRAQAWIKLMHKYLVNSASNFICLINGAH